DLPAAAHVTSRALANANGMAPSRGQVELGIKRNDPVHLANGEFQLCRNFLQHFPRQVSINVLRCLQHRNQSSLLSPVFGKNFLQFLILLRYPRRVATTLAHGSPSSLFPFITNK